jgi:7-cyano-7-deazaguanine synthase
MEDENLTPYSRHCQEEMDAPLQRGRARAGVDPEVVNALVVLSGGQDSTTCLFLALNQGFDVHAVTFNYNQRHNREIFAAQKVFDLAKKRYPGRVHSHELIEMGPILKGTSPLINNSSELEQYKDHASLPGGLEKTFVPMRNQLFLTVAANRAYVLGCEVLVTGVAQEDYGGYPDCRQSFIHALARACNLGTFTGEDGAPRSLAIMTPLMSMTKRDTVEMALRLPGCYQALAHTHTSYDGAFPPTGKDHATLLRAKGFEEAGVPDPLVLRCVLARMMPMPESPNYSEAKVAKYRQELIR